MYTQFETPLGSFYVVSHFQTPVLDASSHSITITGSDGRTVDVSVGSLLRDYSPEMVAHTMQCAGNGRAYFAEMDGWQLGYGALGTARWTGTAVSEVFFRNDITVPDDAWVMAAGADGPAADANRVFARSIPASELLDDCVLAYRMNGHSLPLEHGFPVRLLVPGWYGTNSVKWLAELCVMDGMVRGSQWRKYSTWQQRKYRILPKGARASEHAAVGTTDTWAEIENIVAGRTDTYPYVYDMTVKSLIAYPGDGATVSPRKADGKIEILGVAWAGDDRVSRVEVSTDGGDTWSQAQFLGPYRGPAAWRRFRYRWTPSPGDHTLYSRATDEHGRIQPRSVTSSSP